MRLPVWTSALAAVVFSTVSAHAQPSAATPTAYFSMGSTIQSVALATYGSPSPSLVYSGPTRIGDLALCADETNRYRVSVGREAHICIEPKDV